MKRIMIKKELCTACMNCVVGCMAEHNDKGKSVYLLDMINDENESRNQIVIGKENKAIPIICRHCDEAECANTCMSGAMKKDYETGHVNYDEKKCASCYMCVMSCPFGVLKPDSKTGDKIVKCDFCGGREVPRCVESCPVGAIYLEEVK
ncbi:MAG: 4Fe-4S dicluster domain-containing protein [Sarcina sp.]